MTDLIESINLYVQHKIEPGSFLRAVLENDLKESFGRADEINRTRLFEIVKYIYNHVPMNVWGSKEIVQKHLDSREF
jgi:hypothetical protein